MPAHGPALTVAAVARRLGVAPSTLRTWDRRYGLGPSGRVAGERRRYLPEDLGRLERMRRLTHDGVAPAEAARLVQVPSENRPADASSRSGGPGGRILALPRAAGDARGLSRAAMSLDCAAIEEIVLRSLNASGVIDTWNHLVCPVLRSVGDRWAATGDGVEVEHLLAEAVTGVLRVVRERLAPVPIARPILLCGTAGEGHSLPLHALATALAERGVPARMLGGALPDVAVLAAVRRTGPAALFLWSQLGETARAGFLPDLPVTRPPTVVLVGGPGWDPDALSARVTYAHDLGEAVHLIRLAAGVG